MPSSRTLVAALVVALAVTLVAGATAAPSPDLVRTLRAGGLVLVLRHAATDFSKPGRRIRWWSSDCSTQRNLSGAGTRRRARDRRGRAAARAPCRQGATRAPTAVRSRPRGSRSGARPSHPALLNTIAAEHDAAGAQQIRDARRLSGRGRRRGRSTVLVTHGVVVAGDDGTDARGGRGDRLPAAREQPVPRRRTRDARGSGGRCATGLDGGGRRCASRSTPCPRARTRTTSRPRPTGRSGTRRRRRASSAGSTRRRGRRRRSRSATGRRRTASSSGPTAPRG